MLSRNMLLMRFLKVHWVKNNVKKKKQQTNQQLELRLLEMMMDRIRSMICPTVYFFFNVAAWGTAKIFSPRTWWLCMTWSTSSRTGYAGLEISLWRGNIFSRNWIPKMLQALPIIWLNHVAWWQIDPVRKSTAT